MYSTPAKAMRYAGVQMRSRLEALFAAYLDGLCVEWHYEPHVSQNRDGRWTPDFLVSRSVLVEVKPTPDAAYEQVPFILRHLDGGMSGAVVWYDGNDWRGLVICPPSSAGEQAALSEWPPAILRERRAPWH